MKTLKEQTAAKVLSGRLANPIFMKTVDDVIEHAKSFQQGKDALDVGQQAPNFRLPNPEGKFVSFEDLIEKGPVIITFYRGGWCPYCNLQLNALQKRMAEIHSLGAQLIAISPQVPDGSLMKKNVDALDFIVLSDQDAVVASRYGVAWEVPDCLVEHMKVDRNLDLEQINNGNGNVLPIPATFIVGTDRKIRWRYLDVDYRTRSEPEDIIKELKKM